jgi:tRNA A-37 threonylcarbamoyl transferase component Bud32
LLFDSNEKLREEQKMRLVRGIATGMFHLHKYSIIHRDLAARNILLTASGEPKITVMSNLGYSKNPSRNVGCPKSLVTKHQEKCKPTS